MSRRIFLAVALALGFAVPILPAAAAEKIVLQLDRPAQFEFAGYYAALWQGYYRAAGLEVVIKPGAPPGQTPIDPVREVTEGRARFGTGSARLLIRDADGLPLLLLAPIFQDSGARVYYRADADFSSPGALVNAKLGRLPASNILDIELRTALKAEGIDADTLHSVPIAPGGAVAALANKTVDAVIGSAWRLPWQAHEQGLALKSFDPAAYRTEFYGDSLFTLQRFASMEPGTVARFRAATLKGWEYALLHPDEMAARMVAQLPTPMPVSDPAGFARYQAKLARKLARYPAIPLGHSNPERWHRIAQAMAGVGALARPADLGGFLYDPQRAARQGTDRRAWEVIAAAAVVLLLAGIALVRYRRRLAALDGFVFSAGGRHPQRGLTDNAAALAEELRGIADRVGGALEHIRRQTLVQPHIGRFCATAVDGLDQLRAIVRRLTGEDQAVNPTAADLNATVTALERAIRRSLPRGVGLRLSLLPDAWLCRADPEAVAAAILDLARAAADDMPAGGELILGTRNATIDAGTAAGMEMMPGSYLRLTVRDGGPGLSDETLAHIFDAQTTARPAVAAALRLMRAQGGFVRVESAEGIGTAVHLYFPRWIAHNVDAAEPHPDEAARAAE
jgi:ABC-type nitrate/sulfonate/bicarbonate transport system substrate-binding protein/nitrogen-specific signal transduction histidine kinase